MGVLNQAPTSWTRSDVENDTSWIQRLSEQAIEGIDQALVYAKRQNKPYLAMSPADFPLNEPAKKALEHAVRATQTRWGFCLVQGFPVERWTEEETRLAYWGMGLHMGVARTQNKSSDILNDVRDVGAEYYKSGRGYNTRAELDFHIDFGDIVSLLCRRTAKIGGRSLITSTRAVYDEVVRTHPELVDTLHEPFYFSWQGASGKEDGAFYSCTIAGFNEGYFAYRSNLKNIIAAQRDFPEVPRLTDKQQQLLDPLEVLYRDPRLCYSMHLETGDMQIVNNYSVIHSRTSFEDYEDPDLKRHLIRLWLGIPQCQPLPHTWSTPYKNIEANSVRGGLRGKQITPEFLSYEKRLATYHEMDNSYYETHPL
jgi:hypothetical protein